MQPNNFIGNTSLTNNTGLLRTDSAFAELIVETAGTSIIVIDDQSCILYVNPACERIFGYSHSELVGESVSVVIPESLREEHDEALSRYLETGERKSNWECFEVSGRHKDGSMVPLVITFSEFIKEGKHYFTGMLRLNQPNRSVTLQLSTHQLTARALTEASSFAEASRKLLEALCNSFSWERGETWMVNTSSDRLQCLEVCQPTRARETGCEIEKCSHTLQRHEGLPGKAWANEDLVWSPDATRDLAFFLRSPQEKCYGGCAFPISNGGEVLGVMAFYGRNAQPPGKDAVQMYLALGRQIAHFHQLKQGKEASSDWEGELERRVQERTAALEARNRDLEAFAYTVSHDFRAPLRAIIGFTSLVKSENAGCLPADGRDLLDRVENSARHLDSLIHHLLAFSGAKDGPMASQNVDVAKLVKEVLTQLAPGENYTIQINSLPNCHGDPDLLRQVFMNLLSNAIKYSSKEDKPRIEIGHSAKEDSCCYYVRDNGVGFEMDHISKLFKVFERLHDRREFPGTGVGLAIVDRIVRKHGGRIWAESRPNEGATFYFMLPSAN
ncbi:MAG: ATP-binding protein [Limisphaerales bacterium]